MTIYIVDIEAVDTRYTKQWKDHLPDQLRHATNDKVVTISGVDTPLANQLFLLWIHLLVSIGDHFLCV